jgi:sulfate/thiosulfate-binding protein
MIFRFWILALLLTSNIYATDKVLNVSYDPTRQLYDQINKLFEYNYKLQYNKEVKILQSHGGSGKQARSVIEGIPANIVSLATGYDIEEIVKKGFIKPNWQNKFPNHSAPFTSTIVFLVKKNNPQSIHDWEDLIKDNIKVIMPNPKTSGVAKLDYIAAWGYALEKYKSKEAAYSFMKKLFKNIPVLDSSSRAASISFTNRQLGDVLVTWENEAYLALKELGPDKYEIVIPSLTIQASLPVAIVNVKGKKKQHLKKIAKEYINFLYSKEAQEIGAQNYFRPTDPVIFKKYQFQFHKIKIFDMEKLGNIEDFYHIHFNKDGILDKIFDENKIR